MGPGGEIDISFFDEGLGACEVGVGVGEGALEAQFVADDGGELYAAHHFVQAEEQDLATLCERPGRRRRGSRCRRRLDDDVRAFAAEAVADGGDGIGFTGVDEVFGSELFGDVQASVVDIDHGDVAVAEETGEGEQEAALRACTEDGEGAEVVLADEREKMDAVGERLDHDGALIGETVGDREDVGRGRFRPLGEGAVDPVHADQAPGGADIDAPRLTGVADAARHEGIEDHTLPLGKGHSPPFTGLVWGMRATVATAS